jgi:hypothetical protein
MLLAFARLPLDYRRNPVNKINKEGVIMADALDNKPSTNFWIIGVAALIWNLLGIVIYVGQVTMSPEALARLTEDQQNLITSTPAWANAAWAIAVNAGAFGSLLMLLRKRLAIPLFLVSLIAIVIQDFEAFVLRDAYGVVGINSLIIPSMVLIIAVALFLYSRVAKNQGWLS